MTRKLKVTVLVDAATVRDDDPHFLKEPPEPDTEHHVIQALRFLGYPVSVLGVSHDVGALVAALEEQNPGLVFNLTEQFGNDRCLDKNVASLLEMTGVPFTGTGSMGMMLCRDKRLCKELLALHKIRVPAFISLPPGRKVRVPRRIRFPLVVKPALEDGSEGISNASVVYGEEALAERAVFIHERWNQPAIAEEYIEGRELYVSVLGNRRLRVLPPRECFFNGRAEGGPMLATYRVKWNRNYQKKWNIRFGFAGLASETVRNIERVCRKVFHVLHLQDFARIDLRLTPDHRLVVLEANPNPDIAYGEEVAEAAEKAGIAYEALIEKIVRLALRRMR
jgi:D-alanine-D-alanine ligase